MTTATGRETHGPQGAAGYVPSEADVTVGITVAG
jgi:hypothetical protein